MQPWWSGFAPELLGLLDEPFELFLEKANGFARARGLNTSQGHTLQFVAQEALSDESLAKGYEAFIAQTGDVPTRDLRHDRLNALVWLSASRSKRRLNALHDRALREARQAGAGRGALRDALTLVDENLMVIACQAEDHELRTLLENHNWQAVFGEFRNAWGRQWQPFVFGHALLEKLNAPFKAITAHCLLLGVEKAIASWQELDEMLCKQLGPQLRSSQLLALPVMGLPGWCEENASPEFYFDTKVFRPKRRPQEEA